MEINYNCSFHSFYFALWVIFHTYLLSMNGVFFLKMNFFQIESKFQKYLLSECQTILIQIRPNNMLCPIWVQIVCKGYQLTMKYPGSEVTVAIRPLVKSVYQKNCFSYFSTKKYVVGTQKNHLNETVLLSHKT